MLLMKTISTCVWFGKSEHSYEYQIFSIDTVFRDVGGNFILCDHDALGEWNPLYIGQAHDLFNLLGNENLKEWMTRQGVTHIHVHLERDKDRREQEKADLIERFRPRLNRVSLHELGHD